LLEPRRITEPRADPAVREARFRPDRVTIRHVIIQ
jgi:hypothetical protein